MINIKNVPEIRFKGCYDKDGNWVAFTHPWEQRKLEDIIEKLTGGASIAPDDYVDAGYRTIPKGAVNSSGIADMSGCKIVSEVFFKKNISSKTSSGELVTSLRDLVSTAPNMGRIVRICGDYEDFLMPQGVYSIIVKKKISEDFLIAYSNSPEYRKIIMAEKNGSTQVHIRNGEFLNIDIPLPSYEEQMKIGKQFNYLDHLITLHQRKADTYKKLKKCMLQKMFPKDGEIVPERRFPKFTEPWKKHKFGDVVHIRRGLTYRPTDVEENGIRVLRSSNINENTFVYGNDDIFVNPNAVNIETVRENDILITSANGSSRLIGKHTLIKEIPDNSAVHGGFMLLGRTENYDFVNASMNSSWYTKFINVFVAGGNGAIGNLNKNDLGGQVILFPNDDEQIKVGKYFSTLDNLINITQQKVDIYKKLKKCMLQKMFV